MAILKQPDYWPEGRTINDQFKRDQAASKVSANISLQGAMAKAKSSPSSSTWQMPNLDAHRLDLPVNNPAQADGISACEQLSARICRKIHSSCDLTAIGSELCPDCAFLDEGCLDSIHVEEFLRKCRATHQIANEATSLAHSSHVAAFVLTENAQVLECDGRGRSFLKTNDVLKIVNGELQCSQTETRARFSAALKDTASSGRATNLLVNAVGQARQRFSLAFIRMKNTRIKSLGTPHPAACAVLCLVAPLDRRRIATARQLMELFALTAAEARLARALCQGYSLEEYAQDQGLKLPTVRTQLGATFAKTGTERQAALVRLIAGIPVIRETG